MLVILVILVILVDVIVLMYLQEVCLRETERKDGGVIIWGAKAFVGEGCEYILCLGAGGHV